MTMSEAKRNGLEHLRESLLLAAEDMEQAAAAANALRTDTSDDASWRRALEAAMAVCYMRPFTSGEWKLPGKYSPKASPGKELHAELRGLRNKIYAHSEKASGRKASIRTTGTSGDIVSMEYRSGWLAFDVANLHAVQALCHDQRERFLTEAAAIHVELEEDKGGV
jgi:hypothetical protein